MIIKYTKLLNSITNVVLLDFQKNINLLILFYNVYTVEADSQIKLKWLLNPKTMYNFKKHLMILNTSMIRQYNNNRND